MGALDIFDGIDGTERRDASRIQEGDG